MDKNAFENYVKTMKNASVEREKQYKHGLSVVQKSQAQS